MSEEIRILRKSTCPSLSVRSELAYEFGYHNKTIMFRITENTGSGHFCDHWVPLDDILKCLQEAKEPFSLSVFKTVYCGQSINNTGFLGAALKKEGLIVCEKRQYMKKDTKPFIEELNKLTKATKTTTKKASKKEASK
ncbi:hypothetical protein P9J64_15160 [Deltaproteobacteria bacterium IMCC39524]|nr:hypothetical protein [Deltaproteobacteria bacterium IMCC39524]